MMSKAFAALWSYMRNKVAPRMHLKPSLSYEALFVLNEDFQTDVVEQFNFSSVPGIWGVRETSRMGTSRP